MSQLPGLRYNTQTKDLGIQRHGEMPGPASNLAPKNLARTKIWELSSNLHCSIIGTCLTGGELRQFLHKMGDADSRTATDHSLHGRGVMSAGRADTAGKMLQKTLDRRHETIIKRFHRVKTAKEVRALWRECFDQGEISGAYWAVLTHAATDRALVNDVFGEVHMLSHLVGSASRLDVARLQKLQRDADRNAETLARQEARLQASSSEQSRLQQRIAILEHGTLEARASATTNSTDVASSAADTALRSRLNTEISRGETLGSLLAAMEGRLKDAELRAASATSQVEVLQRELDALEAQLFADDDAKAPAKVQLKSLDTSVLYVGGRRNLFDRLRTLAEERGIHLLIHDGGIEDSNSYLAGLVGQADVALFPIDCVSHSAALMVKRLCRETGKRFVPLRSASLTSFLASLDTLEMLENP
ncbi:MULTISPECIES: DUF2325 domain-containing protein [unclassified Rhizobium]|uniref:DUF2325 domain-containing protein n=1 Tax=unclassified Rhizobium TaxID=2613769 RepID=UPI001ADCA97B|nr:MULTISPECIES: DUF2325 domain-containing protein [unclassified Rhizobium]MBO9101136.1 DUF2325 domain-containing protein [Rhizobium sp. L58/93]MBO9168400.1 DUF2325 domain-containing protein [Rhizobium sp. L245/93]QXZ88201.1 DUF2325 domain-containing protein [Rhizobium sp. K1/93]QXZ94375.1 DUF2325 domain-containing protein [Rhizobium sp. K15/93]QYA05731.1 DUF2325 domain-containing protein [Rhizobium sp. B21/90]